MSFQKGQSGNPAGRPRGSRNRKMIILQQMLDDDGQAILEQAMKMAKEGNVFALRLCMERLLPKRRHEPLECELPPISKAADTVVAMGEIASAVGIGDVAPAEAAALAKVVAGCMQALVTHGLDERLTRVEAAAHRWQERQHIEPRKLPAPAPAPAAADDDTPACTTVPQSP
jgi:hypothetical protein